MELYPTLFIEKYRLKNEAGLPIEFDNHYFMRDLYDDMSPLQVWLKPPQIGATLAQLIKVFYCAKKNGWDIIYTLPSQSDVNDMAGGKINRLIAQNPILFEWVKDHDTVEQKSVGDHIIYFRGTWTTRQAMMVTSDLNVHDEVDASNAEVILSYETRLQAKKDGRRWYFSHPSIAGYGVDKHWQLSDKKEWFVTCPSCKKEQQLSWPDNIDQEKKRYQCSFCKKTLPDDARKFGEWKPTAKGDFSGYHISQLMCSWITAEKIVNDFETKDALYFHNYVLGLPYVSSENKITSADVLKNCVNEVNDQGDSVIIGVDTGLPVHFCVLNKQGVFYYGTADVRDGDPYRRLEDLLIKFPRSIMVADQGGDLIGIRKLQEKYKGRVFLCFYRKDRKGNEMIRWGEGREHGTVIVDRNRMISLTVEQLKDGGRIRFNGTREDWKPFANHFENIYKTVRPPEESPYGTEFLWERSGPDHFVHALVYALSGLDKYGTSMATVVGPDMFSELPMARIFEM